MPPSPTERTSEGRLDGAIDGKMLHAHHVRDRVMLSQDITGALFASWIELRTDTDNTGGEVFPSYP